MKINKTCIIIILNRAFYWLHPLTMQCCLTVWGQSSLIFELPPEAYHNSITQKGDVTLQKRRLQFLAPNLMCKHSYHECNHGNNKEGCESLISQRRINKCSIQIQGSSGQVHNITSNTATTWYRLCEGMQHYGTDHQRGNPSCAWELPAASCTYCRAQQAASTVSSEHDFPESSCWNPKPGPSSS